MKRIKDSPAQKHINRFFGNQLRRLSRENNKANTKNGKRRDPKTAKK